MDRSELKSVLRALAKVFEITILIIIILIIILNIIIVMVSITNILQKCSRSSSRSPSCPSPYDQLSTNPCRYCSPLMVIAVPRWWTEVLKRDWRAIQQVRLPPGPATITHRFTLQEFRGFSSISLKISRNLKPDLGTRLVRCNSNFNRKHIWSQASVSDDTFSQFINLCEWGNWIQFKLHAFHANVSWLLLPFINVVSDWWPSTLALVQHIRFRDGHFAVLCCWVCVLI